MGDTAAVGDPVLALSRVIRLSAPCNHRLPRVRPDYRVGSGDRGPRGGDSAVRRADRGVGSQRSFSSPPLDRCWWQASRAASACASDRGSGVHSDPVRRVVDRHRLSEREDSPFRRTIGSEVWLRDDSEVRADRNHRAASSGAQVLECGAHGGHDAVHVDVELSPPVGEAALSTVPLIAMPAQHTMLSTPPS